MRNGERCVASLLAVVVVLLVINLVVIAPGRQAQAQPPPNTGLDRPVALWVSDFGPVVFRMHADGTVESNRGIGPGGPDPDPCEPFEWCGWQAIPELPLPQGR